MCERVRVREREREKEKERERKSEAEQVSTTVVHSIRANPFKKRSLTFIKVAISVCQSALQC